MSEQANRRNAPTGNPARITIPRTTMNLLGAQLHSILEYRRQSAAEIAQQYNNMSSSAQATQDRPIPTGSPSLPGPSYTGPSSQIASRPDTNARTIGSSDTYEEFISEAHGLVADAEAFLARAHQRVDHHRAFRSSEQHDLLISEADGRIADAEACLARIRDSLAHDHEHQTTNTDTAAAAAAVHTHQECRITEIEDAADPDRDLDMDILDAPLAPAPQVIDNSLFETEKSGPENLMLAHGYAGLDHSYKNQRECVELAVALGLDLDAMIAAEQKLRIFQGRPDSHPHKPDEHFYMVRLHLAFVSAWVFTGRWATEAQELACRRMWSRVGRGRRLAFSEVGSGNVNYSVVGGGGLDNDDTFWL
ncbi:hypothetical protein GGR56DRAFT_467361 [Xylariaceae sp. FL0804]|nr:hypothetical protein GGR56DRAFT_467361 [Xylariaceae sp. FL0804]